MAVEWQGQADFGTLLEWAWLFFVATEWAKEAISGLLGRTGILSQCWAGCDLGSGWEF